MVNNIYNDQGLGHKELKNTKICPINLKNMH